MFERGGGKRREGPRGGKRNNEIQVVEGGKIGRRERGGKGRNGIYRWGRKGKWREEGGGRERGRKRKDGKAQGGKWRKRTWSKGEEWNIQEGKSEGRKMEGGREEREGLNTGGKRERKAKRKTEGKNTWRKGKVEITVEFKGINGGRKVEGGKWRVGGK